MNLFQRRLIKFFILLFTLTTFTIGTQTTQAQDCTATISGLHIEWAGDDVPVFCNQNDGFCASVTNHDTSLKLAFMTVTQDGQILACRADGCFTTDEYPVTINDDTELYVFAVNFDPETINPDGYAYFDDIPFEQDGACIAVSESVPFEVGEAPEVYLADFYCTYQGSGTAGNRFAWEPVIGIIGDHFDPEFTVTFIKENGATKTYDWTNANNDGTLQLSDFPWLSPNQSFSIVASNGYTCLTDTLHFKAPNVTCGLDETCSQGYRLPSLEPFEIPCVFDNDILNEEDEFELISYEVFSSPNGEGTIIGQSTGTFELNEDNCSFTYFPVEGNENQYEGILYTATINGLVYTCSVLLDLSIFSSVGGNVSIRCILDDNGDPNGEEYELTLSLSGGQPPYTVEGTITAVILTEASTNIILPIGTSYDITVTDANGATKSWSGDGSESLDLCAVVEPMEVELTLDCFDNMTGDYQVYLSISDGQAPYQMEVNGTVTTFEEAGTYTAYIAIGQGYDITVTDTQGTSESFMQTGETIQEVCGWVVEPMEVELTLDCFDTMTEQYSVYLDISDGQAPYEMELNGELTIIEEPGLHRAYITKGLGYDITVTDAQDTSESFIQTAETISEVCGWVVDPMNVSLSEECILDENGMRTNGYSVHLFVTEGVAPYTIQFKGVEYILGGVGGFTELLTLGEAYDITVTDASGTQQSFTSDGTSAKELCAAEVGEDELVAILNEDCILGENGVIEGEYKIHLHISGGTPPYSINCNEENFTLEESGNFSKLLMLGDAYNIIVTDANGNEQPFISDGTSAVNKCNQDFLAFFNESCDNHEETGFYKLDLVIAEGLAPYTINVNGDITTLEEAGNFSAYIQMGNGYVLSVTDAQGREQIFASQGSTIISKCSPIIDPHLYVALSENCIVDENGVSTGEYEVTLDITGGIPPYQVELNGETSILEEAGEYPILLLLGSGYNITVTDGLGSTQSFTSDGEAMVEECSTNIDGLELNVELSENCVLDEFGRFTGEYEVILSIRDGLPPYEIEFNGQILNLDEAGEYPILLLVGFGYNIKVTDELGSTQSFTSNGDHMVERCSNTGLCDISIDYPYVVLDDRHNDIGEGILYCATDTINLLGPPVIGGSIPILILTNAEGDILGINENGAGVFPIEDLAIELEEEPYEVFPYVIVEEQEVSLNFNDLKHINDIWAIQSMGFNVCQINDINYPPLIILPPIKATVDIMCEKLGGEDYEAYHLNVKITGGLPAYEGMGMYTFTGGSNANDGESTTLVYDPVSKSAEVQVVAESGELFMLGETYTFQVTDDAWSCASIVYSETPTLPICITTPIDLVSFNANANTEGNTIHWTTAHELEHDYFILEYAAENGSFERLTIIAAEGSEGQGATYEWHHSIQKAGTYYYKLIAVDRNGERVDHGVVTVKRKQTDRGRAVQVSPIPAVDNLQVNWTNTDIERATITLYNTMGQAMFQTITEGNELNIPVQQLPAGIYYLSIDLGEEILNEKIIVE